MKTRIPKSIFGASLAIHLLSAKVEAATLPLAQIPSDVKTGFQYGLGLLFMVGFIWGVINIWSGADKMKRAGAAAIMGALFYIFGMSDGVLTPQF